LGKYQEISIKQVVSKINDKYFLPEIQREFIWDKDKTKFEDKLYDLFDSILRGYPIGTLLFWETHYKNLDADNITVLKFIDNSSKENEIIERDNFREREINLVLDGQQRMTVLNLAFNGVFEDEYRGKPRKRNLYLNLLSEKDPEKEVNERVFDFKLFEKQEDYFFDDEKLWWKIKKIIDPSFSLFDESEKLAEEFNFEKNYKSIIGKNLEKLQKAVTGDNIYYYLIDSTKSDDEALEIFVRVNSGGVALTYSDLLFSKIKQYWKKGDESIDAREEFKDFIEKINKTGFNFDIDFILKTSLVLINSKIAYRVKNFNKENVLLIKENWDSIKEAIGVIINLIKTYGISNKKQLRSNNALIPMIYFVYKNKLKEIDPANENYQIFKKYLYGALLNSVFGGQTDNLLLDSRKIINENNNGLFPIQEIFKSFSAKNRSVRKNEELFDLIDEIKYKTDKSRLIFNILYGVNLSNDFQEDHIFRRTEMLRLGKSKNMVDNIANLQPLGSFTNNSKNDLPFKKWLEKNERSEDYLDFHNIPRMNDYSENNFEEFIKLRREIIYNKLKDFFD